MDMRYTKRVEREMMLLIMKCLAMFRKSKGYTTKDMAEYIGVSRSLYEKIEFGARLPSRSFLKKFKEKYPDFDINIFFEELTHETCD